MGCRAQPPQRLCRRKHPIQQIQRAWGGAALCPSCSATGAGFCITTANGAVGHMRDVHGVIRGPVPDCHLSNGDGLCTQGHGTRAAHDSCNGRVCPSPAGRSWFCCHGRNPQAKRSSVAPGFVRGLTRSGRESHHVKIMSVLPPPPSPGLARGGQDFIHDPPSHLHLNLHGHFEWGAEPGRVASLRNRNFVRASRQTGLVGEGREVERTRRRVTE